MAYDLILRGGRVIDPSQKLDPVTDVAFASGKVARMVGVSQGATDTDIRDVSGFRDARPDRPSHPCLLGRHFARHRRRRVLPHSGVTTSVDTGSAGPGNFAGFRKHVIEPCQVRILAYLHVSYAGIYGFSTASWSARARTCG